MSSSEVIKAFRSEYSKTPSRIKVRLAHTSFIQTVKQLREIDWTLPAQILDAFLVYAMATGLVQVWHVDAHIHAHAGAQALTHARTRAHTHTHTHAHIHTYDKTKNACA